MPSKNDQQRNQIVLLELLSLPSPSFSKKDHGCFSLELESTLESFSPEELAHLYAEAGFLHVFLVFLAEENWIQKKERPESLFLFQDFITPLLAHEGAPLSFFHSFLKKSSLAHSKMFEGKTLCIEKVIVESIKKKSSSEQRRFSQTVLEHISELFEFENHLQLEKKAQGKDLKLSLYRTYDSLDKIFNLDYDAENFIKDDHHETERLYEGSGVGVQSGYSTLLTALRYLNPSQGSRLVDLGSGYGRLGLVIGLLRPDIDFLGYEFVKHRVEMATLSAENLSLQDHVHFYTQDLSLKEFHIPEAEIYYMYDPFSEETYQHVLRQLVEISHHKKITIATKGNAKNWLSTLGKQEGWALPQELDSGNLCLFSSR